MTSNSLTYDFTGSTVLVTGGTSGIGAAIAAAYADAGAEVIITGTRPSLASYSGIHPDRYRYEQLDVEDAAQIDRLAGQLSKLDILVNNAGLAFASQGLDEWEPDVFARAVNMHLISGFRLARGCRDVLAKSHMKGGASIIGIGSMSSYFGIGLVPGYGAGKTGLLGLTRAMAVEWGPLGIRANAVAVGLCESGMTKEAIKIPELSQPTLARTPLGRHGQPEDVAGAVLFLTSENASWITGQMLPIDGGYTVSG